MHSNYILSPDLIDKIRALPSSHEFGTEHASMLNGTEYDEVEKGFLGEIGNQSLKYDETLIQRILTLVSGEGKLPNWGIGVREVIQPGLFQESEVPNNNGTFVFSKQVSACLNDIALATAYFISDVSDSILYHPQKRTPINFRDYDFDSQLEFIMSLSAYGISQVRSLGGSHKSKKWLSKTGDTIEITSNDHQDPLIRFRNQGVPQVLSPLGIFVDFKPDIIDKSFQFSQQTEPQILGTLFSYVSSQKDMTKIFGESGSELQKIFGWNNLVFLINEDLIRSFMRNAQKPIQNVVTKSDFCLDLFHRLDGGVFVVNQNQLLEFRRMDGLQITDKVLFSLTLEDAIEMIHAFFTLLSKQSTFRTMPTTGKAFISSYFSSIKEPSIK